MSRFLTRALFQGRVALSPFTAATPLLPRARLLPQLHASLFSTEAPQPAATSDNGPNPGELDLPPPPSKSPEELAQMPYVVRRTVTAYLPVYKRIRGGGTRVETVIKRVHGDGKKLAQEMGDALEIDPEDVRVNPTTNHIEIKGTVSGKVRQYLLKRGF